MAFALPLRKDSLSRPALTDPQVDTPNASDSSDPTAPVPVVGAFGQQDHHPDNPINARPREFPLSTRARTFSTSSSSSSSVKRKPLPLTASPLAIRFSSAEHLAATLELPEEPFSRPYSLDSPTLYEFPDLVGKASSPHHSGQGSFRPSNDQAALTSENSSDPISVDRIATPARADIGPESRPKSPNLTIPSQHQSSVSKHARLASDSALSLASDSTGLWHGGSAYSDHSRSATMSVFSSKATPLRTLTLPAHAPERSFSHDSTSSDTTVQRSQPKSPGASKLTSFFGWGGNASPSSPTTFSEKAYSPIPSPTSPRLIDASKTTTNSKQVPSALDISKANADAEYFGNAQLQIPPATPTSTVYVEEMEEELKAISSELASSIRREMDLEDLVDRLQAEAANPSNQSGKRTSDYFSDSGYSSVKYGESDSKQEELDRILRKAQQEKAQVQLELTAKVQEERTRRVQLETQIRRLEDRAVQSELASMNSISITGRLKELEATCEDLRRRLAEERQVKDNFEDLFTALKGELQNSSNERDNLRDEIVPQLRARVEGLEAQASAHEKLTYEQTKMQQELQTLRTENNTLLQTQKMQNDMQQMKKFNTIAEEVGAPMNLNRMSGLTRSNSAATRGSRSRPSSMCLQRSGSFKTVESREALSERVKDVELQRDALHAALKNLLERQEYQSRENEKRLRQLEMERDRALLSTPKRISYDAEVAKLREEINTLRNRADEAIQQKWQVEKGLSGLKMDLDRAEQEIASLKSLLEEKDILIPAPGSRPNSATRRGSNPATSESLELAYRELQKAYADSLARVDALEVSATKDAETDRAMKQLEQSLSNAISERDFAIQEADALREQSNAQRVSEHGAISDEIALANQLRDSAKRVEELATQVRQQLASNSTLRQRLAETIERGEKEQKNNAMKIMYMQSKLKSLEDKLLAAQQASEDTISRHEDEIRDLRESHNVQLARMKDGLRSTRLFAPKTPLSPMFANSDKAPRIISTSSGKAMSVSEDSKVDFLKQRVLALEGALADADKEMEEVVGRMNVAQIEVMELQNEREEAVRETRRLQKQVEEERVKAFEGRFATLST